MRKSGDCLPFVHFVKITGGGGGGKGGTPRKIEWGGVLPETPYPVSDQNLRLFSNFRPERYEEAPDDTLFQT